MECTQWPVPEIQEDLIFQHAHKQTMRVRPPKLKPRYHYDSNFNRSHLSASAQFITFRNESSGMQELQQSSIYNRSADETYFEQCFTRISKIGEGSFGEVFKVRCKEDGLLYAVKMSKQLFRSENYRQERLEEVKRYEQFSDNENCVRFYKAWEQDDRLYMQMELCQESLERYLQRKQQITESKIWSILLDLLLALKSLHDKNLIHLDIKLDNILIGDDDSCKLADFGLVIDVDRANRHQVTEGDSRYIAPEVMQGHFSKAADIFSLGMAILELSCCLDLPSNGPLWQQLRSGILPENFIQSKSADLQAMIKLMMTPEPCKRPTVDQLLGQKKMVAMLQRRRRWEMLKKVKHSIRQSCRVAWLKLKHFVVKYLVFLFTTTTTTFKVQSNNNLNNNNERREHRIPTITVNKTPTLLTRIISSTPTTNDKKMRTCLSNNDFTTSNNHLDFSSQLGTPTSFGAIKIVNSTPLNHSHQSMRSRKDLTKTSFKTLDDAQQKLPMDKSNSFLCLEDIETRSSSFIRYPLDTSSMRGKKLFCSNEDIE